MHIVVLRKAARALDGPESVAEAEADVDLRRAELEAAESVWR